MARKSKTLMECAEAYERAKQKREREWQLANPNVICDEDD